MCYHPFVTPLRYLPQTSRKRWALQFISAPGSPALCWSHKELNQWIERYASFLHGRGVKSGDRIGLFLANSAQLLVALFGNHLLGAVTVPINPASTSREFADAAERAEISGLVSEHPWKGKLKFRLTPREFWKALPEIPHPFPQNDDPEAPALLCFTSGTTARPKGVVLTHRNLRANLRDLIQVWEWTAADRLLLSLPLFHIHGLGVGLHGWALTGCSAVITERFDPAHTRDLLIQKRCTLFMGVPTLYRRLLDVVDPARHRFSRLRLAITGSAPMPLELHRRCRQVFGQTLLERYGMTETLMNTSNPLHERRPGSVGLPLPSVQIRLVDEHLQEVEEPGRPGEVWVRGPNVLSGYWRDPEATARAFSGEWFRTGDLARRDKDGYYQLLGRLSLDLIKSGGYRIGAREVEEVLERHPAVREAAVVGMPDQDLGERVTAFVVTRSPLTPDELLDHCRLHLALYKCPRSLVFVPSLPKNSLGKIVKLHLKSLPVTPPDGPAHLDES